MGWKRKIGVQMKSKFFKGLVVKGLILASALAFVNCDDSSSPAAPSDPIVNPDPQNPTIDPSVPGEPVIDPITGEVIQPADPAVPGEVENPGVTDPSVPGEIQPGVVDPTGPGETNPTNPSDPSGPAVDPIPAVSSSSEAPIVSSSSETPVPESSSSVEPEVPKGIFLANDKDENKDYMEVEYIERTGWDGAGILSYPKRLSETQKHGVVVWGPGGGTPPGDYPGMIKRLASHGFVVIALKESPGNGNQAKSALDWLEKKNGTPGDPLYQKLDMTKVGASGHSMGGLESEQILIKDKRVITAILNNSGDWGGNGAAQVPTGMGKTIALVYGEVGSENTNAIADYNNAGVKVPACLIEMRGNNYGHGSGPWDGQAATVAWMRWHLGGEEFRKADFVGTSGKYINGPIYTWQGAKGNWNGKCKNF